MRDPRRCGARRGTRLRACLILPALLLWGCGKRPAPPAPPAPAAAAVPEPAPHPIPEPAPPAHEPPPEPPPEEPTGERGWRYGDDLSDFIRRGPKGMEAMCGQCHAVPPPGAIVKAEWARIFLDMNRYMMQAGTPADPREIGTIQEYYIAEAPVDFRRLPLSADPGRLEFRHAKLGGRKRDVAKIANVRIADLDGDSKNEILVCDVWANDVSLFRRGPGGWTDQVLAACDGPARATPFDADGDGDADIAVAVLGAMQDNDEAIGSVLLLVNDGGKGWERRVLAKGLQRVADVQPADFDRDGDLDLAVAAFGGLRKGSIGWLRNGGATWDYVKIADRTGAIHVPVADFDADGRPDFAALVAQDDETVTLYMNREAGFEAKRIFAAGNPLFGCSGMEVVDLDRDGDVDVLFTNGDALSDPCMMPWPYHGVQWLENTGKLEFRYHDIGRCYGSFRATAADLDRDGDLDVAVAVMFGMWADARETGLLWFENDGRMNFSRHDVPAPRRFITMDAGDLDGDGTPELVTGQMDFFSSASAEGEELLLWTVTERK